MRSEVSEERGLSKPWKNFTLRKNVEVVQNCGEEGGHGDASMCGVSGKTNQRRLRKCGHRDRNSCPRDEPPGGSRRLLHGKLLRGIISQDEA